MVKVRLGRAFWINCSLCCVSVFLCLIMIEVSARLIIHYKYPKMEIDIHSVQEVIRRSFHQKPLFKPHPYLSFVPSDIELTEDGCLIDGQKFTFNKPPGVLRIACLGGSTTMRAYPISMKVALEECFPGRKIEVMDWGCSNWTIVESMINYMVRARLFRPDVVISHEGVNDVAPRLNKNFRFDYSHYRKAFTFEHFSWLDIAGYQSWLATWLRLRAGQNITDLTSLSLQPCKPEDTWKFPVAKEISIVPYRESLDAMAKMAKSDGAALILAGMMYNVSDNLPKQDVPFVEENNSVLRNYANKERLLYIDLQHHFEIHRDQFLDHVHLNRWGNQTKGFLLASAVATIKDGTPFIWIPGCDRKQNMVFAQPDNRKITIQWNSLHHDVSAIHIFVRVNGGAEKSLVKMQESYQGSFHWVPGQFTVEEEFRDGPEFGNTYEFVLYSESPKGAFPPLLMVNPIRFEKKE